MTCISRKRSRTNLHASKMHTISRLYMFRFLSHFHFIASLVFIATHLKAQAAHTPHTGQQTVDHWQDKKNAIEIPQLSLAENSKKSQHSSASITGWNDTQDSIGGAWLSNGESGQRSKYYCKSNLCYVDDLSFPVTHTHLCWGECLVLVLSQACIAKCQAIFESNIDMV
ncbi:hypothetical protein C8R43DRAFT_1047984 [Mycena crocata]|nr:hypothetical protein C8R43DRAFT_1047984 [Mycena crocata]